MHRRLRLRQSPDSKRYVVHTAANCEPLTGPPRRRPSWRTLRRDSIRRTALRWCAVGYRSRCMCGPDRSLRCSACPVCSADAAVRHAPHSLTRRARPERRRRRLWHAADHQHSRLHRNQPCASGNDSARGAVCAGPGAAGPRAGIGACTERGLLCRSIRRPSDDVGIVRLRRPCRWSRHDHRAWHRGPGLVGWTAECIAYRWRPRWHRRRGGHGCGCGRYVNVICRDRLAWPRLVRRPFGRYSAERLAFRARIRLSVDAGAQAGRGCSMAAAPGIASAGRCAGHFISAGATGAAPELRCSWNEWCASAASASVAGPLRPCLLPQYARRSCRGCLRADASAGVTGVRGPTGSNGAASGHEA